MPSLPIRWQRLVKDGLTCTRCGDTEVEVRQATETLREVLAPLGIEPRLEVVVVDETAFAVDPLESNRVWIGDAPSRTGSVAAWAAASAAPCAVTPTAGPSRSGARPSRPSRGCWSSEPA